MINPEVRASVNERPYAVVLTVLIYPLILSLVDLVGAFGEGFTMGGDGFGVVSRMHSDVAG